MDVSRNPPAPEELLAEMVWLRRLAGRIASDTGLAEDAFQDTMLAAVRRGPAARTNLRGWLGAVLRNAVRRRATHERRLEAREKAWARGNEWSRREPLDVSERFALEHDLSRAVRDLEEDLRLVVLLRFLEGRSLREISERVGAPISTVDARLSRALALLRARLERSHGEGADGAQRFRAALLSFLVPEGQGEVPAPRIPWVPAALISGAAGLIVLFAVSDPPDDGTRSTQTAVVSGETHDRSPSRALHEPTSTAATSPRVPLERAEADTPGTVPATGSAEIRLVDEDGGPLVHLVVALWPGESTHPLPRPLETDADGRVLFRGLRAGSYAVATDRLLPRGIEVRTGETVQATLAVRAREISGVVVDEAGMPVTEALVWVSASPGGAFFDGAWTRGVLEDAAATRTDAEGRFRLDSCGAVRLAGARARDRAPTSPVRLSMGLASDSDPSDSGLRLVLAGTGGSLEGRVLGPEGPLADALVLVEAFEGDRDTDPLLATRSDASGEFRLVGIASGERAVTVRAAGLAPWRGSARVEARSTAWVTARLDAGACLAGVVRDRTGQPVAGAELRWSSTESRSEPGLAPATVVRSLADGSYLLPGLPSEEGRLSVLDTSGGRGLVTLALSPGERRALDPVLEPAREVRGLLRDEDGNALEGLALVLSVASSDEVARAHSDARGRFVLSVPGPGELRLRVFEGAWPVLEERIRENTAERIAERDADLERTIAADARPRAFLRGTIPGATGRLLLRSQRFPTHRGLEVRTGPDGRFEAGPLPAGEILLAWKGPACVQSLVPERVLLVADEVRELGVCHIAPPGSVLVHLDGCGTAPVHALVRGADGREVARSEVGADRPGSRERFSLAEASYTLQLWSETCAPRTLAFDVRAGELTELHASLESGTPCQLVVENPAGPRLRSLELTLSNGQGETVLATTLPPSLNLPDAAYHLDVGLLPGVYGVRATRDGGPSLADTFEVEPEGPGLVRLQLE